MSASLNNVTTSDSYTSANSVSLESVKVNIQVNNAAIYFQTDDWDGNQQPEVFLTPGAYSFVRKALAVRVRSAVVGTPAQVTVEMLAPRDV